MQEHTYNLVVAWSGNLGFGTRSYDAYSREHVVHAFGKPSLRGSSDPAFRGDASCYNPEELLVAALSACHMLWYLHLCATEGVEVHGYTDQAEGVMSAHRDGGRFVRVVLRPRVQLQQAAAIAKASALHDHAHAACYIASSVNFPVRIEAAIEVVPQSSQRTQPSMAPLDLAPPENR